jgi:hypothetical protein
MSTCASPRSTVTVVQLSAPGERLFSTDLQQAVAVPDAASLRTFGILDLPPGSVSAPPKFTEAATLAAMRTLNIAPEDLVPQDPDLLDMPDVSLRVGTKLELERRRYARIQRIIAERNRILCLPALPGPVSGERTAKRKGSKRKDFKKRTARRSSPQSVLVATQISVPSRTQFPHRRKPAVPPAPEPKRQKPPTMRTIPSIADAEARRRRVAQVQRAAAMRMAKAKKEESVFDQRRRKFREASEAQMQSLTREYMRLQEKKQKALEEERAWRRVNLYFPKQANARKANAFSEFRKEFLSAFTQPPAEVEDFAAEPLAESLPPPKRRPPEARIARSGMPTMTDASIRLAKRGVLRSRIPAPAERKKSVPM